MFLRLVGFLALIITMTAQAAHAQTLDPSGYWLTEEKTAVVHIAPCENSICGHVYWLPEDGPQFDKKDPAKPICGMKILYGFEQQTDNPNRWEDGNVYKSSAGELYDGDIEVLDNSTLYLRGYLGISLFGKSQHWKRVNPDDYKQCVTPEVTPEMAEKAVEMPKKKKKSFNQ